MAVHDNNAMPRVLNIFSWYVSYKLHGTPFGGEGFFCDHMKSIQEYCEAAAFVPFEEETPSAFTDQDEWGIRTFRYKFADWYIRFKKSKYYFTVRKLRILDIYELFHFIRGFRKVYKIFKPDVIHAHAAENAGICSAFLLRLYGIPLVLTEHQTLHTPTPMKLPKYRHFMFKTTYKMADKVVCVSKGLCELLSKVFQGIDFTVIHNGIYDLQIDSSQKKYRREGFINCVIVAGFYDKNIKGFQFLLPAIDVLVHQKNVPIVLHVCGGGKWFDYFKDLADQLKITDNCIFYGQCTKKEVYSIVSEMDFGISASLLESAGVSVEEMMLLGKPLVVTKSGGANSLVTDLSAIVVDKGSTEALIDGLLYMSEHYGEYDSKAIREYALQNFGIDGIARKYAEIYRELAEK